VSATKANNATHLVRNSSGIDKALRGTPSRIFSGVASPGVSRLLLTIGFRRIPQRMPLMLGDLPTLFC